MNMKCIGFIGFLLIVMFTFPMSSYADVSESKTWTITFNTEIDPTTVNEDSIKVSDLEGNMVGVQVDVISDKVVEVRSPSTGYEQGSTYLLRVSSGILSEEGVPLKEEIVLDFTIRSETADNQSDLGTHEHEIGESMDIYSPDVSLNSYGIEEQNIDLMGISKKGENLSRLVSIEGDQLKIDTEEGLLPLDMNEAYKLKVYMKNGDRYYITFRTSGLPIISSDQDEERFILVPAQPEKGFNYPYFLRIPSDEHKQRNEDSARRLMVVPNNTGPTEGMLDTLERTQEESFRYPLVRDIGEKLWSPVLIPAFPRYRARYDGGYFYSHALDRYTMTLDDMYSDMKDDDRFLQSLNREDLTLNDIEKMSGLDLQLESMIDHAISYLNENNQGVESDKVFLSGYSAEGNFTNRWAALHPERVKAVASGGVNSTAIIPMEEIDGRELIYPIGVADVEEITGQPFDLKAYNNVANFMYQGEGDRNDTYQYSDTFGPEEKQLIKDFMGEEMYPTRWENNKELYFQSSAEGAFGLYYDLGHEITDYMISDLVEFFRANRESEQPVYPSSTDYLEVDSGQ
ncbi:hypothetical protein H0266_10480 [Halobacillus locisalis]|uniref:SbsA Ig-like domain-containing protein n=1 Tax=Halobacillus locisalis TaxID=220753 RepID=A0A838CT55_9BACI|nr:Ig-like domain-containing protein [Halobacillus locisalis]MBA2175322.1 hypothetical protein [Halobacillus locisalis]